MAMFGPAGGRQAPGEALAVRGRASDEVCTMHEAAAVAAAIERGVPETAACPPELRFLIRDPVRADEGSVRFLAAELLRARGLGGVRLDVEVATVRCGECRSFVLPTPLEPICPRCRAPIPPTSGPAIVVSPVPAAAEARDGAERCA
jgi:hypothetical protein